MTQKNSIPICNHTFFLIWLFMQRTSQGICSYSSIHDRQLNNIHNRAFWSFLWEEVVKWSIIPIDEWMNE
jgi:hypothetical protein